MGSVTVLVCSSFECIWHLKQDILLKLMGEDFDLVLRCSFVCSMCLSRTGSDSLHLVLEFERRFSNYLLFPQIRPRSWTLVQLLSELRSFNALGMPDLLAVMRRHG